MKKFFASMAFLALCFSGANADIVQNQEVYAAANTIRAFACDNNQSISYNHVAHAKAVAILTDVVRSGAVVSTQSGNGIFAMKDEHGKWSSPLFIKYRGFGIGPQLGYESNDMVVLFQTTKSFKDIFEGETTLSVGAGASFVNGKRAEVATDLPEVSAYMISPGKVTGIYLGASVDIGKISVDDQATNDYYGRIYDYEDILNDSPKTTKYTRILKNTLSEYLGNKQYYCKNCFAKAKKSK